MKFLTALLILFFLGPRGVLAQDPYTYKSGDPNGIGKWYMGRQIARVMSHYGISWLERPEREKEEGSSMLMRNLALKPGMIVADIGAGSGYYSVKIARELGKGKVYAVDVEPQMIAYLENRVKTEKINNLFPVQCGEQSLPLPAESVDIMLLVDVYHEFSYPYEMARTMLKALKPGGKLYLVEYRMEDPEVPIKTVHKMSEAQAIKELTAAGYRFERNIANLPWQHCLVFSRPQ